MSNNKNIRPVVERGGGGAANCPHFALIPSPQAPDLQELGGGVWE